MSTIPLKIKESTYDNGNSGSSITINWNNGRNQRLQLNANCTISFTNTSTETYYYLFLRQNSTGNFTPTFPSTVKFSNGSVPAAIGPNLSQMYRFFWNGTNYLCDFVSSFNETQAAYNLAGSSIVDPASNLVWVWGNGSSGLGNGTSNSVSSPVIIQYRAFSNIQRADDSGAPSWMGIDYHTGMLYGWGNNFTLALGTNSNTNYSSPVTIARSASYNAVAINSFGGIAIDSSTKSIYTWGTNSNGALGNNAAGNTSSPVTIARSTSYSAIARGFNNNGYAIDAATGMIWAWGNNNVNQIGNNTATAAYSSPVTIARSVSYSAIAAGAGGAFAIQASTGMIWAWGLNSSGQLGNNSTTSTSSPVTIARSTSYSAIAAAQNTVYAIDAATGMVWAWGSNGSGQVGNNTATAVYSSPVTIARSASYIKIAASSNSAFALDSTGVLWAWGVGANGSLGNNSTSNQSSPVSVARLFPVPTSS